MDTNAENVIFNKELFIKMYRNSNIDKRVDVATHTNAGNVIFNKELFIKMYRISNIDKGVDVATHTNAGNVIFTKELYIKINRISNIDKGVDVEVKEQQIGNLRSNPNITENPSEKPVKIVKFNLETKTKKSHNLRKLEHKNYAEESIIDTTITDTENPNKLLEARLEGSVINLEKKDRLPVYQKVIPDDYEPQNNNQIDLYEFVDISPKIKQMIQRRRMRRSSILFDKNTHEILQKIEENEAREKKKHDRRNKKELKPVLKKTYYDQKVNAIVSDIRNKICKRNGGKPETTDKTYEKQNLNNNIFVVENPLNGSIHIEKNVPFNGSCDNVTIQNDIDSCFGFDDDQNLPIASTPCKPVATKGAVHIMANVLIRHGNQDDESHDLNVRRPNANSTMIDIGIQHRTSSPWRPHWVNMRSKPHFSVKGNALPRIDQELVLDHTLVEEFESLCTRTPKKTGKTPAKRAPVQQSILNFIESNVEKENDGLQGSLFCYEAFNSPIKKDGEKRGTKNQRVKAVKTNLGNKDTIASSTPIQRRVLGDISNSTEQFLVNSDLDDITYFGFNESPLPENAINKQRNRGENRVENLENDNIAKPSRFDLSAVRSYAAKVRKKKIVNIAEKVPIPDVSTALVEVSDKDNAGQDIHLFEEPEEMLDNMSPAHTERKNRRKRLSCDSRPGEHENRRKRHKTKLEIEQEKWIEEFNHMCAEIDQHELELE